MKEIKIYINENKIYELNDLEVKILRDQIVDKEFDEVMRNWATSFFIHRLRISKDTIIDRWTKGSPSLLEKNGVKSIPTNEYELIQLIFEQPNYEEISERYK